MKQKRLLSRALIAAFTTSAILFAPVAAMAQPSPKQIEERVKKQQKKKKMKAAKAKKARKASKEAQRRARKARKAQAEKLFAAKGMKSGRIIVVIPDEKKAAKKKGRKKGREIKGLKGFREVGKRKVKRDDLAGASRVAVFEKLKDGRIVTYEATSIGRSRSGKKQRQSGGAARTNGDGGMISGESYAGSDEEPVMVVSEPIVVEEGSGEVQYTGEGPRQYIKNDSGETLVPIESGDVIVIGEEEEAAQWTPIYVEGEEACDQSRKSGEDTWFSTLGGADNTCGANEKDYRAATYTGTISCSARYGKNSSYGAAFRHLTTENCYSCPTGYDRSLNPDIKASDACVKTTAAKTLKKRAENLGPTKAKKPSRGFRDGDSWWRCPKDKPRRTAYAVTHKWACATPIGKKEKLGRAERVSKVNLPKPKGAFVDPRNGGEYWRCPSGYDRSAAPVTAKDACIKRVQASTKVAKAKLRGQTPFRCGIGSFQHGATTGCYTCGALHVRSTIIVDDPAKDERTCVEK